MTRNVSASSVSRNQTKEATEMPKVSRDSATQGGEFGPVVDRSDDLDGYTVNFTSFSEDTDATCAQSGHWQRSSGSPFMSGAAAMSSPKDVKSTVYPSRPSDRSKTGPTSPPCVALILAI